MWHSDVSTTDVRKPCVKQETGCLNVAIGAVKFDAELLVAGSIFSALPYSS